MKSPRAAGVTILAESTGRILLIRRSQRVTRPGLWSCPAGRIDPGEAPLETALRETEEEVGYAGALTVVDSFQDGLFINFVAWSPTEFKAKLNWESDCYGWFTAGCRPHPLHPGMRRFFESRV